MTTTKTPIELALEVLESTIDLAEHARATSPRDFDEERAALEQVKSTLANFAAAATNWHEVAKRLEMAANKEMSWGAVRRWLEQDPDLRECRKISISVDEDGRWVARAEEFRSERGGAFGTGPKIWETLYEETIFQPFENEWPNFRLLAQWCARNEYKP